MIDSQVKFYRGHAAGEWQLLKYLDVVSPWHVGISFWTKDDKMIRAYILNGALCHPVMGQHQKPDYINDFSSGNRGAYINGKCSSCRCTLIPENIS